MLIDQGFATDALLDGASAAARGVYAGIAAVLRLARRDSLSRAAMPAWIAQEEEALAELHALGAASTEDGLLRLAPLGSPFAVASAAPVAVEEAPASESAADRKRRAERERKARLRSRVRGDVPLPGGTESGTCPVEERDKGRDMSHGTSGTRGGTESGTSRVSEKREEEKREEIEEIREGARRGTRTGTEGGTSGTTGRDMSRGTGGTDSGTRRDIVPLPASTDGLRPLLDEHRATVPDWALAQIEADAVGTGRKPDPVTTWQAFCDHQLSQQRTSASWAAEWRRWLARERTFASRRPQPPPAPVYPDLTAQIRKRIRPEDMPTTEDFDKALADIIAIRSPAP